VTRASGELLVDVLDHHDRGIDHRADRHHDAAERHDVLYRSTDSQGIRTLGVVENWIESPDPARIQQFVARRTGQLDAAIRQAFGRQVGDSAAETNNAELGFDT
jgi:hypothetical protein